MARLTSVNRERSMKHSVHTARGDQRSQGHGLCPMEVNPETSPMMRPAFARRALLHSSHVFDRTLYRRGVEVAIWGMPIVSVDAMRQAFFRDARAKYGDIVFWSKPADAKFQFATPNASTYYAYFNFNTKQGPLVLEVPATAGARLSGSLIGAWQAPLADIGIDGEDKGHGGRYLLKPPSIARRDPPDYITVPSDTYNGYGLFRITPASSSDADVAAALSLVRKLRVYPLARASDPPEQRFIDMAGTLFDGSVRFDDTFFDSLARMIDEEPIQQRDLVAMGQLHSIGIQKGRPFTPDHATRDVLRRAADEAHLAFMENAMVGDPFWPDKHWILPAVVGPKTRYAYETGDRLEIDERGTIFYLAFAAPKRLGASSFYVGAFHDNAGDPFRGDRLYRLHVPARVPAKQSWSATIYDTETSCFIRDSPRLGVDSYDPRVQRNPDGSVEVFVGPKPPIGRESNWIYTKPGKHWFSFFRFYGPEKPLFEKSWKLMDFEKVQLQ